MLKKKKNKIVLSKNSSLRCNSDFVFVMGNAGANIWRRAEFSCGVLCCLKLKRRPAQGQNRKEIFVFSNKKTFLASCRAR